jgi:hypothetical protein
VLASFLRKLATSYEDLGVFGFLPPRNMGIDSGSENTPEILGHDAEMTR